MPQGKAGIVAEGAGPPNRESQLPKRRVVFAWDMQYSCNFRCPYCWYTIAGWTELAKKNIYLSAADWRKVWKQVHARYGRCQLRITAGEPFTYPDFPDVVAQVSEWHDVQITSNCSHGEAIRRLAETADPARVELDCTFHPLSGDFDSFIENVLVLRKRGFLANVCYLAYPPQIPRMAEFKRKFAALGVYMNMAVFWGAFKGKQYPFAYSDEEKRTIKEVVGAEVGPETVNLEPLKINGKVCGAGQCYAVVQADGRVYRCGQLGREGQSIGGIFDEDFTLSPEGRPCTVDFCRSKEFQSAWGDEDKDFFNRQGKVRA